MFDNKAVVVLSGGQDSTTCLHIALLACTHVSAITFDYGQQHSRELDSARAICALYKVDHEVVSLRGVFDGSASPLVSGTSVAQYKDKASLPGGLEATFVEGRNLVFLAVAAGRAKVRQARNIYTGVSQEDFGGYPDCRLTFIRKMQTAINAAMGIDDPDSTILLKTPLLHLSKARTVLLGASLERARGVALDDALALSHTCYRGHCPPCGRCHACILRKDGYEQAGKEDPLIARARAASTSDGRGENTDTLRRGGSRTRRSP